MEPSEVQKLIAAGLPGCEVTVTGDGSHFQVTAVGEMFAGLNAVKRQQAVYATVNDLITNGTLHALSIKACTPEEWEKASKLQVQ